MPFDCAACEGTGVIETRPADVRAVKEETNVVR